MGKHYDLDGKIAVVTGAGSGIGREVALVLAEEGAAVALLDVSQAGLDETARLMDAAGFVSAAYVVDVSQAESVARVFKQIEDKWSRVDILVTCAAIIAPTRTWDVSVEEWSRIVAVNLTGTFLPVQSALRIMRKQRSGKIITFGSDVAKRGGGRFGGSAYAASKGGVLAFTRTVAREVALEGISVNCVNPGPTKTPIHKGITPEQMEMLRAGIPKGRLGEPRDLANAVAFLASDLAEHIHGETLNVDGGVMMD